MGESIICSDTGKNLACCVGGNVQYRAQFHVFFPETESEGNFAPYCSISYSFPLKET